MESYRAAHPDALKDTRTSRLTKLYSDTKKSALISLQAQSTHNAQFASLHRKYRIQKDRLITWGLAWSDDEKGPDGDIDESVAKAGLTETVESVLCNIQEVTEEAERIKSASLPVTKVGEKLPQQPAVFDEARYEDLLRDLTTSIDTLYDLSISRRALARGEHPRFDTAPPAKTSDEKPTSSGNQKDFYSKPALASSESTLVNPSFVRPALSPYAGLPSRIELSALRLPNEGPPPYEAIGVPSTTRMVALLIRKNVSDTTRNALASEAPEVPVLIEYANFDATYRDTGVPPPLQRLESLATFLQPMRAESQTNLSLLGYFEDANQPRIGLVYDLPYAIQNRLQAGPTSEPLAPLSLLKLVQKANKAQNMTNDVPAPALEHRFRMALRLTEQLHSLHARELAHGNINSSSIIFTTTTNESDASRLEQLRKPLWASFDLFSKCTIEGVRRAGNFNIYKHPLDETNSTTRELTSDIKYDLYGLGLVLLEIGLWTPVGDLYKPKYTLPDFKLRLEKIWIPKLGAKCGSAYMRAVETCLRLSDDLDNSRLTVEGIYGVLLQFLKRCCLLDDGGSSTELIPASELISAPSSPMQSRMRRAKRRPSETSSIAKQLSDTSEVMRTQSMSGTTPRPGPIVSRKPVPQQARPEPQAAFPQSFDSSQRFQFSSSPSTKDFRRRIICIQKLWRARQASKVGRQNATVPASGKPKRVEFPEVELPKDVVDHWQHTLCFQINNIVGKALSGSLEACSIRLLSYGESPETARPTLIVGCKSTAKVKQALRRFKYDANMYDVRVKKEGDIRRCRRSRRNRVSDIGHRSMAPIRDVETEKAANPDYQERPVCGASIGAYRYEEHLPAASFGGVVIVDGRPYGMSVHHMLEPEDEENDDEDQADAGADDDASDTSSLASSDSDPEDDDQSTVRPPSRRPSDENFTAMNDTFGDCPGILPGDMEEITITQPALDDAIDLDLHAEEEEDEDDADSGIDEDHLLSYRLGQVHVSSGLKRTSPSHEGGFKSISQSLPQEIDWALFELLPPRIHHFNIIKGGSRFCTKGDRPISIKKSSDLACAKVHCLGRTSGLKEGVVSSTMELVKISGRNTFSASWTIAGEFGIGGDSGAWVISNEDGGVCGHVLASRKGRTYICPMDLLLEDIRITLGAKEVKLPVAADAARVRSSGKKSEELTGAFTRMYLSECAESGGGGVPLPQASSSGGRETTRTVVEPVG